MQAKKATMKKSKKTTPKQCRELRFSDFIVDSVLRIAEDVYNDTYEVVFNDWYKNGGKKPSKKDLLDALLELSIEQTFFRFKMVEDLYYLVGYSWEQYIDEQLKKNLKLQYGL